MADYLVAFAERIEHQAQEAAQRMRQAFKVLGPGSFDEAAATALREASGSSRVVIHTAFDDREPLRACLNAGAVGIVLKDASNLVEALRRVLAGELHVDPSLVEDPRARALRLGEDGGLYESLTQRE